MKRIAKFFLLALLLFSAAEKIFAQDAAAPFRRRSPTPTPSPTAAPKPTPKPTPLPTATPTPPPTPTPTPRPTAAPSPSPTATPPSASPPPAESTPAPAEREKPSRSILREKPVRAVEPRQPWIRRIPDDKIDGPRASKPTFDLSGGVFGRKSTIRALERQWLAAIKNHDADALEKLLDDDFVATSSTGRVGSKERMLRELRNDKNKYRSLGMRDLEVEMKRPDLAVISGVATETGTKENGEKFANSHRFTDTWRRRGGVWKCISSKAEEVSP